MKYVEDMESLVKTLVASNRFHCLVVEGPPGWGKSTTIGNLLRDQGIQFNSIGSFITPFELFRTLRQAPDRMHVFDDSEGIFNSPVAISILRSATWCSAISTNERIVSWRSAASGAQVSFGFSGKLILLTNSTSGMSVKAGLLSRSLHFNIRLDEELKINMLFHAAKDSKVFPNTEAAKKVAQFLAERIEVGSNGVNLRTLELGYELIMTSPESWVQTMKALVPLDPKHFVETLRFSEMTTENQAQEFCRATGMSRRTFYNYRRMSSAGDARRMQPPKL